MNLTQIIEETGKRIRLGKRHEEKLTNAEIKEVLETALQVIQDGLRQDKRIEVQDFGVLEMIETEVKAGGHLVPFGGKATIHVATRRRRWVFRPARRLREALARTPEA